MESTASFYAWLHEDAGYTFNGNSNIAGLTTTELSMLQLGYLVRNEQRQQNAGGQRRGNKIQPASTSDSYEGRKREMREKYIQ